MPEQWKPVVGYERIYQVSGQGRVRRIKAASGTQIGRILRPSKNTKGYYYVNLHKEGARRQRHFLISRLVLMAFVGLPPKGYECNHKNGVKAENYPDNLEWVTHKENTLHRSRVLGKGRGELHGQAKLNNSDIPIIRKLIAEGKTTLTAIGKRFGVTPTTICYIKHGKKWGHI